MKDLREYLMAVYFIILLALLTFNFIGSKIKQATLNTQSEIENLQR